jgi:diguanylate cyclase (GGDEF)-like protein
LGVGTVAWIEFIFELTAVRLKRERDIEHTKVIVMAQTDALTGLANRGSFDTHLNLRIGTVSPLRGFALCYLDLDGFKAINDAHGHNVGDEVLRIVSVRLRGIVRGSDLVSRQGGDEFVLLLESTGERAELEIMVQRALAAIRKPINTSMGAVNVGASIGVAVFPADAATAGALKKAADTAMYRAKRECTGWCFYDRPTSAQLAAITRSSPISSSPQADA